jgi:hypothetical protein
MKTNIDKVLLGNNDNVMADRLVENLGKIRRLEGIIDYYRINGAPSGEIALAVVEFVKRGDEGLSMGAE